MSTVNNFAKISEQVYIYRYSNGYMVEANGRDEGGDWVTVKNVFNDADSAYEFAKQIHTSLPLDV